LAVIAYNLHKIGRKISHEMAEAMDKKKKKEPLRKVA